MAVHAHLKNEFTKDEKYHNLMRALIDVQSIFWNRLTILLMSELVVNLEMNKNWTSWFAGLMVAQNLRSSSVSKKNLEYIELLHWIWSEPNTCIFFTFIPLPSAEKRWKFDTLSLEIISPKSPSS